MTETIRVRFDSMAHGPAAVGRGPDGRVVMAEGAAPGDLADVTVRRTHRTWLEADVQALVEPSAERREPPCRHARSGECGGCPWQHLQDATQRREKERLVAREVARAAPEATVRPLRTDVPMLGYRRRTRLGHRDGILGYRRRSTRRIFDLAECPVLDPRLAAELGAIRHALAGAPSGNVDVMVDPSGEIHVGGPATWFAQPSAAAERVLTELVLEAVPPEAATVLELFAGAGTFTVPLHERGHRVTALEGDRRAVAALRARAPGVTVRQVDLLRGDATLGPADAVLLDPPRAGAAPVVPAVAETGAAVVCYVSCSPATLTRDLGALRGYGYRVAWVAPVDAFPQTFHVECVARLER